LFGPATNSDMDSVIAKLSPDGATIWADHLAGNVGNPFTGDATTDGAANIAVAGFVDAGSVGPSFGGASPVPSGNTGHYVINLAPDGALRWTRGFATQSGNIAQNVARLAFAAGGALAVSGNFDNTVDFGTGPLTAPGQLVRNGSGPEAIADNVFTVLLAP
jgi:hypothetical protein